MKRLYEFASLFLFLGILRSVVLRIQVFELNRNIKTEVVGVLIIRKEKTVPTYSTVTLQVPKDALCIPCSPTIFSLT